MAAEEGEHPEPVYLTLDDALEIFAAIVGGGVSEALDQLRSREALEGALGRPQACAHYEQADLALQANVLAHGSPRRSRSLMGTNGRRSSRC